MSKVFVIGFHKTGTTSMHNALKILGYSVCRPFPTNIPNMGKVVLEKAFKEAEKYDAFEDNPWPLLFKEMDKKYPRSKFILTIRPAEQWIKSVVNHFGSNFTYMREWIYGEGCPKGNEDLYIKKYIEHIDDVKKYFLKRSNDLLILNLKDEDKWSKLCNFLNKKVIKDSFPYANKGLYCNSVDKQLSSCKVPTKGKKNL